MQSFGFIRFLIFKLYLINQKISRFAPGTLLAVSVGYRFFLPNISLFHFLFGSFYV